MATCSLCAKPVAWVPRHGNGGGLCIAHVSEAHHAFEPQARLLREVRP